MRGSELGLTLVELMVTLAIVSIITASLTKMFTTMAAGHTVRVTSADLQQSVRAVMDLMSHEIRMAGFSSLSPGSFGVTMAGPQSFSFTVDWNGDGFITESHSGDPLVAQESDLISYRFDGDLNSLVRETAEETPSESSQSLLGGSGDPMQLKALRFSYLDEQGEETEQVSDIRMVGIEITADLPAGIRGWQTRVYRTHVACRNLGV